MVRPLSAEPVKSRRKGTRNVSTLTPVQLARKRAKDREAQRAIRARTKEHIERLERELAGLRSKQSRDRTVQELLRRNKAIEKELIQLKEIMRESMTSSSYSAPGLTPQQLSLPDELLTSTVYDGNPRTDSYAIPSPRGSPFPGDYTSLPDYSQQYIPLSHNCESLASTVPCLIPSNDSTPASSADYNAGYIPISIPASILPSNTSSSSIGAVCDKDVIKTEYDDVCHHGTVSQDFPVPDTRYDEEISHAQYLDARFGLNNPPLHPGTPYSNSYMPHHQQQQSAWNTYAMYCPVPGVMMALMYGLDDLLLGFVQNYC